MTSYSREETLVNVFEVMEEYSQRLTIRQIYYRLVADYGLENSLNSYKRIVDILSKARLSGDISYDAIEDRTREISSFDRFDFQTMVQHMQTLMDKCENWSEYYWVPKWYDQPNRVVVFVEKQALQGIFADVCKRWEVDLMVCKGYPSLTQQYELANRMGDRIDIEQDLHLIYFGDFDPSGENIPEKMEDRLRNDFGLNFVSFQKEALTLDQVESWGIPPAPAKSTDSRTKGFVEKYGVGMQVELDAIKPDELSSMIDDAIALYYDRDIGKKRDSMIIDGREAIKNTINRSGVLDKIKTCIPEGDE